MLAVKEEARPIFTCMEEDQLIELASQNKSKKYDFSFQNMLNEMGEEEIDQMWEHLFQVIIRKLDTMPECNASNPRSPRKVFVNVSQVVQAVLDIGQAMLAEVRPVPQPLLHLVVSLNDILFRIPKHLDSLRNNICYLCEKMFHLKYTSSSELFMFNVVLYLLKRSSNPGAAKKDVKRVYTLRFLLPKMITMEKVSRHELWDLLKACTASKNYSTMVEGQKVITMALTLDPDHVADIHNIIKKKLSSATSQQAQTYGRAYLDAWFHAYKSKATGLQDVLEITCVQEIVLLAICDKHKTKVLSAQRVLAQFHSKKKETEVLRMIYFLYQPIIFRFVKTSDALIRANAAQLFLYAFPLENPDLDIVTSDMEMNDQMLLIKDLLLDDYPVVRARTIIGLCLSMSTHWELFSEEWQNTYFNLLTDDLSRDSSSSDVRSAVAKGFKSLLENPLTIPVLRDVLPKLKHLFDDISSNVRIAFCQLLMVVKRICGIRYFDIVPIEHILARLEEDPVVAKLIVHLIQNSYFPKNHHPTSWFFRCIKLVEVNKTASREFFRYVPRYIGIDTAAKFMIHTMKTIHLYMTFKKSSIEPKKSSKKKSTNRTDLEKMEDFTVLDDLNIVASLIDAVVVLWLASNISQVDNKTQLKMVVANLAKWTDDLVVYYENTVVWASIHYLASFMPPETVPSLSPLLYDRLKRWDNKKEHSCLLMCLCNLQEGDRLLDTLKEWIDLEFATRNAAKPTPKKRKTDRSSFNKAMLGVELLNDLIDIRPCQKILIADHSNKLKSLLPLLQNLKLKIEGLQAAVIDGDQALFIITLLFALIKISVLIHDVDNFNGVKYVEDIVTWSENKLCKQAYSENVNETRRRSSMQRVKSSPSFKNLVLEINKGLCTILADMTYLGYFNPKKYKFMKFGMQLLSLASCTVLHVSKLLLKHTLSGAVVYQNSKQEFALEIVPDCLSKFQMYLKDKSFISSTPASVLKEVQLNLEESTKVLETYFQPSNKT